ncbi:MFS transporter [Kitasatospora sp. NBC_00315]
MAGSCLPILGAVLIAPVLPKMQDHFASTAGADALVPMALTIPALALALLAPFAGMLVDRLGRKRLLVGASLVYAPIGTAPLWLDSLGSIVAARALLGVVEAVIMTCCTTLIGDYYDGKQRERYLALQAVCSALSATAFFAVGGAIGSAGWRAPFWAYAVSLLLAPLMAAVLVVPRRTEPQGAEAAEAGRPFPWRRLAAPCALTFFGAVVFYTVPVEMSYLLDDIGVKATATIGIASATASVATVIGAFTFTRLADRAERLLPAVLTLCAAGFTVMWLADGTVLLVVGAVVNCLGGGMLLPTLLTRAMALLDFADRGRGTGLWNAAFFFGEFVCPLILLGVSHAVGGLAGAVGLLGAATLVLAAVLRFTRRPAAALPSA